MRRAVYPGTFDPPHRGHIDLIRRGKSLVDELVVAVAVNREKSQLFTEEERVALIEECVRDLEGVRVIQFRGLLVDLVRQEEAQCILRGIRTFSDFESELQMAFINRQLGMGDAETIFVLPSLEYSQYSSRRVKEVASFGGEVTEFLPPEIQERVLARFERD